MLGILKAGRRVEEARVAHHRREPFNDGTGVVLFMVLLGLATGSAEASPSSIAGMFALEAGGGILFRHGGGAGALWMLRQIDSYAVEIMLTPRAGDGGLFAGRVDAPCRRRCTWWRRGW